jgi:hypothetical protein
MMTNTMQRQGSARSIKQVKTQPKGMKTLDPTMCVKSNKTS